MKDRSNAAGSGNIPGLPVVQKCLRLKGMTYQRPIWQTALPGVQRPDRTVPSRVPREYFQHAVGPDGERRIRSHPPPGNTHATTSSTRRANRTARHARSFSEIGENQVVNIIDRTQDSSLQVEQNELKEAVWNALDELKPHEKEIIILKDFQELSYKEIAESLDCPIGTVMSRLFTARQALKNKLESYFND